MQLKNKIDLLAKTFIDIYLVSTKHSVPDLKGVSHSRHGYINQESYFWWRVFYELCTSAGFHLSSVIHVG